MEKNEKNKEFDENLIYVLAAIGVIALFSLILIAIYKITFLAPIFLLISPIISLYLLIKGFDFYSPKDAIHIILAFACISLFCAFAMSDSNGKDEAYLKKWIYGGSVESLQGFVEGDGEVVDHDETYYKHELVNGEKVKSKLVHDIFDNLPWFGLVANSLLFILALKKYDPESQNS